MDKKALYNFRNSEGWKIGVDGSIDISKANKLTVVFVFDQKGLMYNLTLEGAKITKLKR